MLMASASHLARQVLGRLSEGEEEEANEPEDEHEAAHCVEEVAQTHDGGFGAQEGAAAATVPAGHDK